MNKNFLYKLILISIFNSSYGQFIYTGYQDYESWLITNSKNKMEHLDATNPWNKYKIDKTITYDKIHNFGIFFNIHNSSLTNIYQKKSDLIGNGFLTNYHFTINGLKIANSMFFSNNRSEAERGFVRTIKDVTMYTNQAYLKYSSGFNELQYSLKIGRDFLTKGFGYGSKIFFSDFSRPFDQLTIESNYEKLNGTLSVISLDTLYNHNRFLYMHSFEYSNESLNIIFGEAVISTGTNESLDIKYLNPINFWSWENIGSTNNGLNAFLFFGLSWMPKKKIKLYGEILFDDINFHTKDAFFLNRYAYLVGLHKTSFPFETSNIWFEHSSVLNQVYQSYHPTHIFVHRNFPIGHYLGNDFANFRFHYSQIKHKI